MADTTDLVFVSQYEENMSPWATNDTQVVHEHTLATLIMSKLKGLAEKEGLDCKRNSKQDGMSNQFSKPYGGGPLVTHIESLSILSASIGGMIAFIKVARPLILEYMKNRRSTVVRYKKGDVEIVVKGDQSLTDVLDKLSEYEKSRSTNESSTGLLAALPIGKGDGNE